MASTQQSGFTGTGNSSLRLGAVKEASASSVSELNILFRTTERQMMVSTLVQ